MHITAQFRNAVSIGLATVLALGCSESTGLGGSGKGAIQVIASTEGTVIDRDPDGFTAGVDDGLPARLPVTGLVVKDLRAGTHTVSSAAWPRTVQSAGRTHVPSTLVVVQ